MLPGRPMHILGPADTWKGFERTTPLGHVEFLDTIISAVDANASLERELYEATTSRHEELDQ